MCLKETQDSSWNFDEVILEAAKSIAAATSALVKAASAAQRELIDSGKVRNLIFDKYALNILSV